MNGMHPEHPAFIGDAPYIVDAERYGMPHPIPVHCPVCGQVCEKYYWSKMSSEVVGCNVCLNEYDAEGCNVCLNEYDAEEGREW